MKLSTDKYNKLIEGFEHPFVVLNTKINVSYIAITLRNYLSFKLHLLKPAYFSL